MKRPLPSYIFLLLPALFLFLVFYVPSLSILFIFSLHQYVPGRFLGQLLTVQNYLRFILDPYYWSVLITTLRISAISTTIAIFAAYPMAYSLARSRWRKVFLSILTLSFFVSVICRVYGWMMLLGTRGIINNALLYSGVINQPIQFVFSELGVVIGTVHFLIPYASFTLMASIQSIDPSLEMSAQTLGANELKTFLKITLPLSLPGIIASILLSLALCFSLFTIPMILGGGRIVVLGSLVFTLISEAFNFPFAAATVIIMLVFIFTLIYGIGRLLESRIKIE